MKIVIGISGASGCMYGISLLKELKGKHELHLIITDAAKEVIKWETMFDIDEIEQMANFVYKQSEFTAPIASGSFKFDAMVIVPCSIKTLSSIANSFAENLLIRAADVALKERRNLVLGIREMPLHEGHLNLMLAASKMGAVICPLSPSFYNNPSTIEDVIEQMSYKIMDLIGIESMAFKRWRGIEKVDRDLMHV